MTSHFNKYRLAVAYDHRNINLQTDKRQS